MTERNSGKGDDLLALYRQGTEPDELGAHRNWQELSARLAAGEVGPALTGASAEATTFTATVLAGVAALTVVAAVAGYLLWPQPVKEAPKRAAQIVGGRPPMAVAPALPPRSSAAKVVIPAGCRALDEPYADSGHLNALPFGERSQWVQPWRGYLETRAAEDFLDGIAVGLHFRDLRGRDERAVLQLLSQHGVRGVLVEVGWDNVSYEDERLNERVAAQLARLMRAARERGMRLTLRLFSHDNAPCPRRDVRGRLVADARAGDRRLLLADTRGLIAGRSGLSRLISKRSPDILFTAVDDRSVMLSRPLPFDLAAGTALRMTTLKYSPFAVPGTAAYEETAAGWLKFVDRVIDLAAAASAAGPAGQQGGPAFDLEIGNPVTFASAFLSVDSYHEPRSSTATARATAADLIERTARHVAASPERLGAVRVVNGFVGTDARAACSQQPAQVSGIVRRTPGAVLQLRLRAEEAPSVNAHYESDAWDAGVPVAFPELEATALTADSYIRDLAPIATNVQGVMHGRRDGGDGEGSCAVRLSGVGIDPRWLAPDVGPERLEILRAKLITRQYAFFLHKGASQVAIGARTRGASGSGLGLPGADGTAGFRPNLALAALGRMARTFKDGLAGNPKAPRSKGALEVRSLWDCHDHVQFQGADRGARRSLYNREVFAFLPYRVSEKRHVIPYYVMTRDTTVDLPPERYGLIVGGLPGPARGVRVYDPVNDREIPVQVLGGGVDEVKLELEATDSPRLLIIDSE